MRVMSRETVGGLAAAAISVLLICCGSPAASQQKEPSPSTRGDSGMPERLSRQVAPNPSTLWRAPALQEYITLVDRLVTDAAALRTLASSLPPDATARAALLRVGMPASW
jgi:hypothetical protein